MPIQIFNTLTRRKEPFEPIHPPRVAWYNCGPTVYDYFHLGNARNFVVMDAIRRYLEYRGYDVRYVQNFTDIDDKIIIRAIEEGRPAEEIARAFTDFYFEQSEKLNVRRADAHPRATEHVGRMVEFIARLEQAGAAYAVAGDVFFRVDRFPSYGRLSGRRLEDLQSGARVDVDGRKEHPADFVLWKAAKPGEPAWDSPWGKGRPGWHIECSCMCLHELGETLDIHSGGYDLTFPHHENEIAQSETLNRRPMARYWLHNGFLTIRDAAGDDVKMSKSLGNDMKINNVLAKHDPMSVRAFLLSAHYRSPLVYSPTAIEEMEAAVRRLRDGLETARKLAALAPAASPGAQFPQSDERVAALRREFDEAMDDDFNTPKALAALFRAVSEIHDLRATAGRDGCDAACAAALAALGDILIELAGILGIRLESASGDFAGALDDNAIQSLIDQRIAARARRDFAAADNIRARLAGMGVLLEDHPQGTIWKRK